MAAIIEALSEIINEHWVKFVTAAAFTIVGWGVARWRAQKQWEKREFFNRINFSLNSIHNETLLIRTLSEKPCDEVFLNPVAVDRMKNMAQLTTVENPIVPIPKDDAWYYLNAVLNELSEQFAVGLLRRDLGESVKTQAYLICLTNECGGAVRTRKVRVMVIRKDLLESLGDDPPKFERDYHAIRWNTLKHMQSVWQSASWNFLELELCI